MRRARNPTVEVLAGIAREKQESTYEILLRAVLASEPDPLVDSRPQVVVVFLEEARGPVGVASTSERVVVPPVEEDGGGFRNLGHVRVHGVEDIHQFRLDFGIRHRFDTFGPIALMVTVKIMATRKTEEEDVRRRWRRGRQTRGRSSRDRDSAIRGTSRERGPHRWQSVLTINNDVER